jgi:hypothetical protein
VRDETRQRQIERRKRAFRAYNFLGFGANRQIAALADVSDALTPETLLSTAILWLAKLEIAGKNRLKPFAILSDKRQRKNCRNCTRAAQKRWKNGKFISNKFSAKTQKRKKAAKRRMRTEFDRSLQIGNRTTLARKSRKNKTIEIDCKRAKRAAAIVGSPIRDMTLFAPDTGNARFYGLPFARVRRGFRREKIWFGVEKIVRF